MSDNNSQADEILKFKNLMDQGIISEEEFNKKKAEILNSKSKQEVSNIKTSEHVKNQQKNQAKGCLGCLGFIILVIFIGVVSTIINRSNTEKETGIKQGSKLETNIQDALNKVGIEKYEIKRDSDLDSNRGENTKAFRVTTEFSNGFVMVYTNPDDTVYSVRYVDKDYYLNGKVLGNIKDNTITRSEADNYRRNVELRVKEILKAPSTAKFPGLDEWGFDKKDGTVTIQGYVDSQNSFGAMIRSKFQVKYNEKKEMMTSFIFDGEELVKSKK